MTTLGALRYELDEEWLAEQQQRERVCHRTWSASSRGDRTKLPVSAALYQKMWVLLLTCYDAGDDKEYVLV